MILVLTGPLHAGKTTFLKNLIPVLRSRKIPVSGYLSLSLSEAGRTLGYDLFDIRAGRSVPFLRREGRHGWQRVGPYSFLPSGLRAAENLILGCPAGAWLVVDEVGPQELAGRGVWPALSSVLSQSERHFLIVARSPLLRELEGLLAGRPTEVFDVASDNILPNLLVRMSKSRGSPGKRASGGRSQEQP